LQELIIQYPGTVLFVSHALAQIQEICQRVIWLEHGHIKMIGDAKEVCQAYHL
jgi:ABC-type polysaccharide/polyol phosphate transport system ATPase subunit